MPANAAAVIMVNHHAGADLCFPFGDPIVDFDDNTTGFVACDVRLCLRILASVGV